MYTDISSSSCLELFLKCPLHGNIEIKVGHLCVLVHQNIVVYDQELAFDKNVQTIKITIAERIKEINKYQKA